MNCAKSRPLSLALGVLLAGTGIVGGAAWASPVEAAPTSVVSQAWPDTWVKSADGYANVRNGPGTNYQIVGSLKTGTQVIVLQKSGNWTQTTAGGWIANSLLTTTKPGTTSGPTNVGAPQGATSSRKATATLNIRSTPSLSGRVLGSIPKGATVTVTGSASNGWYPVSYKSIRGWASGKYLVAATTTTPTPQTPSGTGNYAYTTTALNLRFGPACSSGVITVLPKGAKVFVQDTLFGWYNVQYGSRIGWASGRYLSGSQITTRPEPACGS